MEHLTSNFCSMSVRSTRGKYLRRRWMERFKARIAERQIQLKGSSLGLYSIICLVRGYFSESIVSIQWRHNEPDGVSNHQPLDCFLNRLFRRRSKKTSKLHVTGLCGGNSPVIGDFSRQRASIAGNVSWRHHVLEHCLLRCYNFII